MHIVSDRFPDMFAGRAWWRELVGAAAGRETGIVLQLFFTVLHSARARVRRVTMC